MSVSESTIDRSKILTAGLISVAVAVVANLLTRAVLLAVLTIDPGFLPFSVGAVAGFTAVGVALGAVVFFILTRVSRRPFRVYTIVAVVVGVLSIIPNIISALDPAAVPFPFPGATSTAFLALIVFHIVAGAASIGVMTTLPRA